MNRDKKSPFLRIQSSAKIILTGEHAVLQGFTAVARGIPLYMSLQILSNAESMANRSHEELQIKIRNFLLQLDANFNYRERVDLFFRHYHCRIESSIPQSSGLGSSAAFSVSIAKLKQFIANDFKIPLKYDLCQIFSDANIIEKNFHKTPSGLDVKSSLRNNILRFNSSENFAYIENNTDLYIAILNTQPRKCTTKDIVATINYDKNYHKLQQIGELSDELVTAFRTCDLKTIALTLNENQKILQTLNLVTATAKDACLALMNHGAIAAKMTGAGLGGGVFGLFTKCPNIQNALYIGKL